MTQTLRRELRLKFFQVLIDCDGLPAEHLAANLADAALEVSGIAKQEKKTEILQNAGADWNAAFGDAQTERGRKAQLEQNAVIAFERAFGGISWASWWGGRKEWDKLREFITAKFSADPECFKKYVAWVQTAYGKGMAAVQIQAHPERFSTAWAAFEMDTKPTDTSAAPVKIFTADAEPQKQYFVPSGRLPRKAE